MDYFDRLDRKIQQRVRRRFLKDYIDNRKNAARQKAIAERFGSYYDANAIKSYLNSEKGIERLDSFLKEDQLYINAVEGRITENPDYERKFEKYVRKLQNRARRKESLKEKLRQEELKRKALRQNIIDRVPDDYTELYPETRKMKRHFVIHIGPTNSGKTYRAIQELMQAETGTYLAPLRLLAYEQFENMNRNGCLCSMLTGEESIDIPFSRHVSSTIEMADMSEHYDVAVIDEAQMIRDPSRGDAWTKAILGIMADEVHICAAEYAEEILKTLITACNDTFEVEYHFRQVPLRRNRERFHFPKGVRKGDALILFTRRDVHACAAELQRMGTRCSVIYGALPYDVRHNEAQKFLNGETDVVVATDAIGMGLNMPIKRIVFMMDMKYDGIDHRLLRPEEVQQIAGRAGRYGIFNEGTYNALDDPDFIDHCMNAEVEPIREAVIGFPEILISLDGNLSTIMAQWNTIQARPGFLRSDIEYEIEAAKELEQISDDKYLIYRFVTIPYDWEDEELKAIWKEFFMCEAKGKEVDAYDYLPMMDEHEGDIHALERDFRTCDLIYYYVSRFPHDYDSNIVLELKKKISEKIMEQLSLQRLSSRKCRICGRPMKWNDRFAICDRCFRRNYLHRYGGK